jgi:hypothetical protein
MKVLRRKRPGATQVAAGTLSSYAVHTVLGLVGQAS